MNSKQREQCWHISTDRSSRIADSESGAAFERFRDPGAWRFTDPYLLDRRPRPPAAQGRCH